MLQNYLKVALRYIRPKKGFSFINIAGLAIGRDRYKNKMKMDLWG